MESSHEEPSLTARARDVLAQPDHVAGANLVSRVYHRSDQNERQSANTLYRFCSEKLPNCLTVMLLKVYKFSTDDPAIRWQSISLLHTHLNNLYRDRVPLSPEAFIDIKKLIISCLLVQDTCEGNFKILSRITSRVALDVFLADSAWDELFDYIAELVDQDRSKAFLVFSELPTVLESYCLVLPVKKLFPEILKSLNPRRCGTEEWILALEAGFIMAIQLIGSEREDLSGDILYAILSSSCELVRVGMEATVREGLWKLKQKVDEEAPRFHKKEYRFVSNLASKMENMKGIREDTKKAAKIVRHTLQDICWEM